MAIVIDLLLFFVKIKSGLYYILQCTGRHLVAVGSEDCTISLVRLCPGSATQYIKVVATLQGHISSVRALSCSPSGWSDGNKLLFSGGARASLKVWGIGPGRPKKVPILYYH